MKISLPNYANPIGFFLFCLIITANANANASASANENSSIHWKQSYVLEAQGQYAQAAQEIKQVLNDSSDTNEFSHLRYAWLNYLQQNYNIAIKYYQQSLKINPQSIDAELGISLVMLAQLRWKEAAISARKVLKQAPANYTAHLRLMTCESGQMMWSQLEKHASRVIRLYPTQSAPWLFLARAQAWLGKKEQASKNYTSLLHRLPENSEALNYLKFSGI